MNTLAEQDLKTAIAGNTISSFDKAGHQYWVLCSSDGKLKLVSETGFKDEGSWEVVGNGVFSAQYKLLYEGRRNVFYNVRKKADKLLFDSIDGGATIVVDLLSGNPQSL
jgi:hypothetical protein